MFCTCTTPTQVVILSSHPSNAEKQRYDNMSVFVLPPQAFVHGNDTSCCTHHIIIVQSSSHRPRMAITRNDFSVVIVTVPLEPPGAPKYRAIPVRTAGVRLYPPKLPRRASSVRPQASVNYSSRVHTCSTCHPFEAHHNGACVCA